jgi:hypothetical protein
VSPLSDYSVASEFYPVLQCHRTLPETDIVRESQEWCVVVVWIIKIPDLVAKKRPTSNTHNFVRSSGVQCKSSYSPPQIHQSDKSDEANHVQNAVADSPVLAVGCPEVYDNFLAQGHSRGDAKGNVRGARSISSGPYGQDQT